jgi:hypothetical protein
MGVSSRNIADGFGARGPHLIRRAVECATITYDQLKSGLMPAGANRVRRPLPTAAQPALAG